MTKYTVVLLNYSRPDNVASVIVPELLRSQNLQQVIISNGKDTGITAYSDPRVRNRLDASLNSKWGVGLRFVAACDATTECVVFQDDDLVVAAAELDGLVAKWATQPTAMHTFIICGRWIDHKTDVTKAYSYSIKPKATRSDIVLTR